MSTVRDQLVHVLRQAGVARVYAIRRTEGSEWIHLRNEEAAAFAAAPEAHLNDDPERHIYLRAALTDPSASLLSALPQPRRVAAHIAIAVGRQAQPDGVAPETSDAKLRERVAATQWTPAYPSLAPSRS
jgi:hypothetical protein